MATENDTQCDDVLRSEFCAWLLENGAKFPKIDWPSNNTDSGIRGAVARADIRTGEHMIEIPKHLMMSPPIIFADPEIGEACRTMKDVLHGDLLLTVFIINELRKGPKSFYSPFLRILPEPGNISEWTDDDLKLLQVVNCVHVVVCYIYRLPKHRITTHTTGSCPFDKSKRSQEECGGNSTYIYLLCYSIHIFYVHFPHRCIAARLCITGPF